ncbi:reverse transcriptase-like protein [Pseudothermotoga sp.]|jgi:ribonuclease HI|uniref:reverse transcriptase-like protein n=1 Tax=Pseudothermotoga sp. TaxID=2033661 RepID=UPI000E9D0396|nr:reverse transcriptase-like protein [Pseudothermotoga sp.]HBJ81393.1 ribonuclease H [Pseudothermotoga sp.]
MTIYTDGSYSNQTNVLGYAFCVVEDHTVLEFSNAFILKRGSSTIAEVVAVIKSLEYCKKNGIQNPVIVHDYNELPFFAFGYRKCPPSMYNFVKHLQELTKKVRPRFRKVEAHKDNEYNNLVDRLAREAMQKLITQKEQAMKLSDN